MFRTIHPVVIVTIIVFLSLLVAGVLFGLLSSTGIVKSAYAEFGGAAAGFFATLLVLRQWYSKMEEQDVAALKRQLYDITRQFGVPPFELPASFESFIDHEHSMLFCYPGEWKRQPLMMQLQSVFMEDPRRLRPGDEFPGNFNVVICTPGQKTLSLKEMCMIAKRKGISPEEICEKLDVELSPKTERFELPLEVVLSLFGLEGQTRQEQIYELNYQVVELLPGEVVRRDIELVDDRKSLLVERKLEQEHSEPVVQFSMITYVPETDLIFTFTFTDNIADRSKIDLVRKRVLSTVKFWKPGSPAVALPNRP